MAASGADEVVRAAYSAWAPEYVARLGSVEATHLADRELIARCAGSMEGRVLDVGCGPGHWTAYLAGLGVDVEGVDLTPAFVESARARFPGVPFRVDPLDDLGVPDGSVVAILAWYSLIHREPDRVASALDEFARCLQADGTLVVGFCRGDRLEPFPHTVTTAYFWPVEALERQVARAGFVVDEVHTRDDLGQRPHGAVVARRRAGQRHARERHRSSVATA